MSEFPIPIPMGSPHTPKYVKEAHKLLDEALDKLSGIQQWTPFPGDTEADFEPVRQARREIEEIMCQLVKAVTAEDILRKKWRS